jgi:hypothetical protein
VYPEKKRKKGEQGVTQATLTAQWSTQGATTRAVTEDLAKAIALDKRPVTLLEVSWLDGPRPET